jgi:hypothetical protein
MPTCATECAGAPGEVHRNPSGVACVMPLAQMFCRERGKAACSIRLSMVGHLLLFMCCVCDATCPDVLQSQVETV